MALTILHVVFIDGDDIHIYDDGRFKMALIGPMRFDAMPPAALMAMQRRGEFISRRQSGDEALARRCHHATAAPPRPRLPLFRDCFRFDALRRRRDWRRRELRDCVNISMILIDGDIGGRCRHDGADRQCDCSAMRFLADFDSAFIYCFAPARFSTLSLRRAASLLRARHDSAGGA